LRGEHKFLSQAAKPRATRITHTVSTITNIELKFKYYSQLSGFSPYAFYGIFIRQRAGYQQTERLLRKNRRNAMLYFFVTKKSGEVAVKFFEESVHIQHIIGV